MFLEDGQREQWFDSELIRWMAFVSAVGFGLLFYGQATSPRPIIKLKLLLDRQFGSVALMGVVLGIVLYGTSYAIPQFLAALANYNALQAGKVVLLSGIPSLILMTMVPILLKRVDIRIAVSAGLLIMGSAALLDANLTAQSSGPDFTVSQLLRGVGQILAMLFLSQACVRSVPPEDAGDASGLFNAVRNLGGSFALAGISILQDQRMYFHSRRIEETLSANSPSVQSYVNGLGQSVGDQSAGLRLLSQQIAQQALTMTYNDIFWIMGVGAFAVLPLVLFLRPLPTGAEPAMVH